MSTSAAREPSGAPWAEPICQRQRAVRTGTAADHQAALAALARDARGQARPTIYSYIKKHVEM